jgi:hypothetical protein
MEDGAVGGVRGERRRVRVMDPHPQSPGAMRYCLPDSSHSEDAEHLPGQLPAHHHGRGGVSPAASAEELLRLVRPTRRAEQ